MRNFIFGIICLLCTGFAGCEPKPEPEPVPELYQITVSTPENGTITSSLTEAVEGENLTFTATPDNGFLLTSVEVNGEDIWNGETDAAQEVEFVMPAEDIEVSATFVARKYAITVTTSSEGTIAVTADGTPVEAAAESTQINIAATPNTGYEFAKWEITGVAPAAETSATTTFTMPGNDVVIAALYKMLPTETTDPGVVFNGVRWATRNVGAPGKFVGAPEEDGMLYQWNRRVGWSAADPLTSSDGATAWDNTMSESEVWEEANNPCPDGWRTPTWDEVHSLMDYETNTETVSNETSGSDVIFTNDATGESILFPATGFRFAAGGGSAAYDIIGYYWTSDISDYYDNMGTVFLFSGGVQIASLDNGAGIAIRCVAK